MRAVPPPETEGYERLVFAKDQPEYNPLPALRRQSVRGEVLTTWELTAEELCALMDGGRVVLHVWTFNNPLQPLRLEVQTRDGVTVEEA